MYDQYPLEAYLDGRAGFPYDLPPRYDDTDHVQITRNFLASPARMMRHLFADDGTESSL